MISVGPIVTFAAIYLSSKALLLLRPNWSMTIVDDTHESAQTARADKPTRIRELMVRDRAAALDMTVDRTLPGLTGAHIPTKKISTGMPDGVGRATGMTIRSNRTEDKCIDRGSEGGV